MHPLLRTTAALLAASVLPAWAATASGTLTVNATLISACAVSGTVLNFGGAIDPLAASVPLDASASLSLTCTNTTPYSVALNAGVNAGGASNFTARTMKSGAKALGYQLYLDVGRATVWGDGIASSLPVVGTGSGSSQTLTIYGRVPSLAGVAPGAYTDAVTVTITY